MDVQHAIERGIAAARANNQRTAYYYFYAATQADPTNEQAWLWRASTAPQPRDALHCLAAVLALNPENPVARHGLEQISAAVAAESQPTALTITPSLSSGEYRPPERRLEWQQAFQRDLYDMAAVPRMQRVETVPADGVAPAPVTEAGGLAYRRPPNVAEQLFEAIRRVFVDRDTQRVQFAIPVVIAVVLLIGAVAILGWSQVASTQGGVQPTSTPLGGAPTPLQLTIPPGTTPSLAVPTATQGSIAPAPATPTVPAAAPASATPAPPVASATPAPPPPATNTAPPPPPPATNTAPPPPPPATDTAVPSGPRTIVVGDGQTLQQIADQVGVPLTALWAFNDLTSRDVTAGQTLNIPPADYKPADLRYAVRSGDNLTNIARAFDTTVDAITQRNGITNASAIDVGQVLIIPLP